MRLRRLTMALVAAVALAAAGFALASCGGNDGSSSTTSDIYDTTTGPTQTITATETTPPVEEPTAVRIEVVSGAPEGGIVRKTVGKGDRVVIVVKSDVADEVHLHGYDITRDVAAGGTATIAFKAELPGRFEVELEQHGVQIADLTVEP